ncbi:MAG: hypothetical protein OQK78_05695 [Gammaproteobacteria bacterium]|nr:hypothetical protein [Gammaproteobacteria bacterium]
MRKIVKLAAYLTILLFSYPLYAEEWQSALGVELFSWHEYDLSGREMVHEMGPRLFVEFESAADRSKRFNHSFRGRLYSGFVKYDGETQGGVPLTSHSIYAGFVVESMLNYRVSTVVKERRSEGQAWYLSAGLGYEGWLRGIQDTASASGYSEIYQVPYSKLGILYEANHRTQLQFGAKLPLMVSERILFSRFVTDDTGEHFSDFNLEPQANLTLYASLDYQLANRMDISLYYDRYLFGASPNVSLLTASGNPVYCLDVDSNGICEAHNAINSGADSVVVAHQPKSHLQTIGVRFNFSY